MNMRVGFTPSVVLPNRRSCTHECRRVYLRDETRSRRCRRVWTCGQAVDRVNDWRNGCEIALENEYWGGLTDESVSTV